VGDGEDDEEVTRGTDQEVDAVLRVGDEELDGKLALNASVLPVSRTTVSVSESHN
jgi:hypothetical protein